MLFRSLYLTPSLPPTGPAASDPALAALVSERDALERQVAELRAQKTSMDPARYDTELERLLTELARKTKELRDREGRR